MVKQLSSQTGRIVGFKYQAVGWLLYSALLYTLLHCCALQCTDIHLSALNCTDLHFSALLWIALLCTDLHYSAMLCNAMH